jgi:hypothetical protein
MKVHMPQAKRLWVPVLLAAALFGPLAGAIPDSARAQGDSQLFSQTGKTVSGKFLAYWNGHGGLAQQGYPISDQMQEVSPTDGKTYTVQYFERAVFEQHPENQPPNDVLLSLLGTFLYNQKYPGGAPGQAPSNDANTQFFAPTKHWVGGLFLDYWNQHGGLAQQGYPISDEFQEKSDLDGKTYKVQYFERAVFEYHPGNQPPYNVLLSQLGTFRYRALYMTPPTPTAAPTQKPLPIPTATPAPPPDRRVVATIPTGVSPGYMAIGAGSLWVAEQDGVARVDPATNKVVATIGGVGIPYIVTFGAGSVWVVENAGTEDGAIGRIDPATNTLVATITMGHCCAGLVATSDAIYASQYRNNMIVKIDPQTNAVTNFKAIAAPTKLAISNGSLWACTESGPNAMARIDPSGNAGTVYVNVGGGRSCGGVAAGDSGVWAITWTPDRHDTVIHDAIVRIDPRTSQPAASIAVPTNDLAGPVAVGPSGAWVLTETALERVDPKSNAVAEQIVTGDTPNGLALDGNTLWVTYSSGKLLRFDLTK